MTDHDVGNGPDGPDAAITYRRVLAAVLWVLDVAANAQEVVSGTSGAAADSLEAAYSVAAVGYTLRFARHLNDYCIRGAGPDLEIDDGAGGITKLGRKLTGDELKQLGRLRRWVVCEFAAAVCWLITAWLTLTSNSRLLLCGASLVTLLLAMILVDKVERARDATPLESSSWYLEHSWFGQWSMKVFRANRLGWLLIIFGDGAKRGKDHFISPYMSVTLLVLASITLGVSVSAAQELVHDFNPGFVITRPGNAGGQGDQGETASGGQTPNQTTNSSAGGTGSGSSSGNYNATSCDSTPVGSVPQPQQADLTEAFNKLGSAASGDPSAPEAVAGRCGTWVMEGTCRRTAWSLTVAPPDGPAETLLGTQATDFALGFVASQRLLDVTARLVISSGDAYGIETQTGTWILIRQHSSTRLIKTPPRSCVAVPETAVVYQVMPPALAGLWLTMASQDVFTWPKELSSTPDSSTWRFSTDGPHPRLVARGSCTSSGCWIKLADGANIQPGILSSPAALENLAGDEAPR